MSFGYCPFTTVAALKAADKILGAERAWTGDAGQRDWIERYYKPIAPLLSGMPEIASNATEVAEDHVAFLKKHGWEAQLKNAKPGELLTAGVMDLLVHWKEEGEKAPIVTPDKKRYPGVFLKDNVDFCQTSIGTAACLETKTADRVWLVLPPQVDAVAVPLEARHLTDLAQTFLVEKKTHASHEGLFFPMVDLAEKQSLDWLVGLKTSTDAGRGWEVAQALQQITLKMNHKGARARAADEMRMIATSVRQPRPPLVINRPFFAIFERPGLPQPLFTAHVTEQDWKDPGEL